MGIADVYDQCEPGFNTEISRENKELTCNYRKESNKEQCSVSNIDPGISDESNKEGSSPYVPVRQSNQCDNYNNIDLESSTGCPKKNENY